MSREKQTKYHNTVYYAYNWSANQSKCGILLCFLFMIYYWILVGWRDIEIATSRLAPCAGMTGVACFVSVLFIVVVSAGLSALTPDPWAEG